MRLHFAEGQLFNPDTGEVWARNVDEEFGPRLASWPKLADALIYLLKMFGEPTPPVMAGALDRARAALRAAGLQ